MAYNKRKNYNDVHFIVNFPFELIPEGFIAALREKDYSAFEYYANCELYNNNDNYWNIVGLTQIGQPVCVVWGTFDRLEKIMIAMRVSIHPHWQSLDGELLKMIVKMIDVHGYNIGANKVIFLTTNGKAYIRKLKELIKPTKCEVLEIIRGISHG